MNATTTLTISPMQHIANPTTGEVRYVTHTWARWLKSYGWHDASFAEWKAYHNKHMVKL